MTLPGRSRFVMEAKPAPRAGVTLFCVREHLPSLWTRMVLNEKEVAGARIEWIKPGQPNHDLLVLNPSLVLPTLADRDTVIHPARVIAEYLDERYPHPRLLPPDPAVRARLRMTMQRFEQDLFPWAQTVMEGKTAEAKAARKSLQDALLASSRLFTPRGWFLSPDFSLVDCAWGALFSQLSTLGVKLAGDTQNLVKYAERVFARPAIQRALR
jgi:RNA polymerase-associated protein